jgi:cytochrome bd-type quinol oxidase subunit 2
MTFIAAFFAILSLAFVDSLNPFSIAAMAVTIAGPNSLSRGVVFILGTLATYFMGGIALVMGWNEALKALSPLITPLVACVGWCLLAVVSLGGAVWLWRKVPKDQDQAPAKATTGALLAVLVFALVSTASDLPTAIPYFGAIPIIVGLSVPMAAALLWLAFYNLVYIAPLILILGLRIFAAARFDPFLDRIQCGMAWLMQRAVPPLLVAVGIWAGVEAALLSFG